MRALQLEHAAWIAKKYPGQTPRIPAIGCLEEAGELVHAVLKMEQIRNWGEDARHKLAELRVKLVDAVGDCGIFACSLCNANGWDFVELWDACHAYKCGETVDEVVQLVATAVVVAQHPDSVHALQKYLQQLTVVAHCLGLDPATAVRTTWATVKDR